MPSREVRPILLAVHRSPRVETIGVQETMTQVWVALGPRRPLLPPLRVQLNALLCLRDGRSSRRGLSTEATLRGIEMPPPVAPRRGWWGRLAR
jgi:hypothetical protein